MMSLPPSITSSLTWQHMCIHTHRLSNLEPWETFPGSALCGTITTTNISFLTYKIWFPKQRSWKVLLLCIATQQVAGCDETGNENKCLPHKLADHHRECIHIQVHIFMVQPATICRISRPLAHPAHYSVTLSPVQQFFTYNSLHINRRNWPRVTLQWERLH